MFYKLMKPFGSGKNDLVTRLFEGFFDNSIPPFIGTGQILRIDARETDDAMIVTADVPGMRKEDLTIEVRDGILYLSCEREETQEAKDTGYIYHERRLGHLSRALQIPGTVDENSINASLQHGVLTVEMKKAEVKKAKKIEIKVE